MSESFDGEAFRQIFESIKDPRIARTRLHPLSSVLFLCLCAVISGADTIVGIQRFGLAKEEILATLMPYPNGIPSHDTICRILAKINPFELERLFSSWMKSAAQISKGRLIAIDGKTLRRAWDKKGGGENPRMVCGGSWPVATRRE